MDRAIEEVRGERGERRLALRGSFGLESAGELRRAVLGHLERGPLESIDVYAVERLEGSAASALAAALCSAGTRPAIEGARDDVRSILDLYTREEQRPATLPRAPRLPVFVQVGRATLALVDTAKVMLAFVAEATGAAVAAVRAPSSVAWRGVLRQLERHGADGLGIVAVIGALMGLITAFQAAMQLSKFGADTLVADLVSLSLTRELAPLMTAIVLAGRSGAAIAAEIGTMKVSEEIDALRTLGICPHRFLVFPRILALVVAAPLLTLVSDAVGIAAGAAVTTSILDVGLRQFVTSAQAALTLTDVSTGLLKAAVFGGLIAAIACERGLSARGGAEGVGRSTTSAVVSTLFWLVVADAMFSVLFNVWGLQ